MCSSRSFSGRTSQRTDHHILHAVLRLLPRPLQWGLAVTHQAILAKRLAHADYGSLTGLPTADLSKRPFLLFWFMALIDRYVFNSSVWL